MKKIGVLKNSKMKKIIVMAFGLIIYSIASAQEMKGMDMTKKEKIQKVQPATYTCVMHPEIHATKPGNCPKCGMKLIKEKPKQVKQPPVQKHDEMQMSKDTAKKKKYGHGRYANGKYEHAERYWQRQSNGYGKYADG